MADHRHMSVCIGVCLQVVQGAYLLLSSQFTAASCQSSARPNVCLPGRLPARLVPVQPEFIIGEMNISSVITHPVSQSVTR